MTQTTSRLFDELGRLMTDAAGAAQGVRKEVETMMRAQAEKILNDLDVVSREEFEAVRDMAQKARMENEALARRIAALEGGRAAKPARKSSPGSASAKSPSKPKTAASTKR